VCLYADAQDAEHSRMVDYRTFGYRRIRVLRPLRMVLRFDENGLNRLRADKQWARLSPEQQAGWEAALSGVMGSIKPYAWAELFAEEIGRADPRIGRVGKMFVKALLEAFGVRDPEGESVRNAQGDVVPDADLTDYENVPLTQDVNDYLALEVKPHVSDAYIDPDYRDEKDFQIGRVGYEINFNRFFYEYKAPRKLEEIDAELKQVESEIAALLGEVTE
jgi:type I restriction enzyme M protein